MDEPMSAATSRIRRICGQGPILLMLQLVALLSVALASGFFHCRVDLLLEPITAACGGPDEQARLQMAEQVMARAGALDDWQPLSWIPLAGIVLALLGAMAVCASRALWLRDGLRTANVALLLLHGGALCLAGWTLHLYENAWNSVARLSPTACLMDLVAEGDTPLVQAQSVVFHILARENATLMRNPDDLALVLVALLMATMVGGISLWRAIVRVRAARSAVA
ncbi:hypothetical protein HMPREF3114_16885 [Stenotrophomonas sp. HMSC10F07]|jgi:hypothetical protein|nr:membrane protein [Stenotrophomonas maltophilia]OFU89662.1 hypothetical protein HMPREF3114_16885 [Stenotrophomonas sp. HMSC10F07]MCF3473834.1 hypothetical protein [Stenotrophomonas maltophilia]MCF3505955.1 hypothetical protein [Stenotrophomonas maltophilia]MCF3526955.1 hypothetical protein [Stenotrophomonas maltophilia]